MLPVDQALAVVMSHARPRLPVRATIGDALGRVLAEEAIADRDLPAFRKAMMDGIAVAAGAETRFQLVGEILAGKSWDSMLGAGQAVRIMTGAALPEGADAVVPVEQCQWDGAQVAIAEPVKLGQHVQPIGRELQRDQIVIPLGSRLRPAHIGLLATVGLVQPLVSPRIRVAVLTTGDEVVAPEQTPGPVQLRNSNGPMLAAQCRQAGCEVRDLGIARDELESLVGLIEAGLSGDIVILSGGVSAGARDLVPEALRKAGVTPHFHKVAMKPGKPLYFGIRGDVLVFGLPGNPVSSFVGFELFVRPAIRRLEGDRFTGPVWEAYPLAEPVQHSSDRPTYHPAQIASEAGGPVVRPLPWRGSPDLKGVADADSLIRFEAGSLTLAARSMVPVLRLAE